METSKVISIRDFSLADIIDDLQYKDSGKIIIEFNGNSSMSDVNVSVVLDEKKEEEKTVPITLAIIKAICGWSKFCDVTGGNHYALKEFGISDREIFDVKESHAKELNLI
jgi:hypothetical protein